MASRGQGFRGLGGGSAAGKVVFGGCVSHERESSGAYTAPNCSGSRTPWKDSHLLFKGVLAVYVPASADLITGTQIDVPQLMIRALSTTAYRRTSAGDEGVGGRVDGGFRGLGGGSAVGEAALGDELLIREGSKIAAKAKYRCFGTG